MGVREGGIGDLTAPGDGPKRDEGAKTEGGVATGDLANLTVTWTIDGSSANPAALCATYNVGYFTLVARVDATSGSEVLSQGFTCANGGWTSESALHNLPYGPYVVRMSAASGACCSGGTTIAEGFKRISLKKGTSTEVVFNLAGGRFTALP